MSKEGLPDVTKPLIDAVESLEAVDPVGKRLAKAIRGVQAGEPMLHPEIARLMMRELQRDSEQPRLHDQLTEREMEVLRCIARGLSNKEIAAELVISEKTVKTHVSNLLQKLHLADRTQAAIYAMQRKLVE